LKKKNKLKKRFDSFIVLLCGDWTPTDACVVCIYSQD